MKNIILASTSPRRKELMELLCVPFEVRASNYEEDMTLALPPEELVQHLAVCKAQAVAVGVSAGLVIGGDTIISLDGRVMGKPHTEENAQEMLRALRGKTHQVLTGLAVIDVETGQTRQAINITNVTFKPYTDKEITDYVQTGEPLDRAGAYAIQGYASLFVQEIHGDYFGVLGLSLTDLAALLKEFGIDVWEGIVGSVV